MDVSPYLLVPVVSIIVCQVLKFAIEGIKGDIDFKYLLKTGGMPTSVVAAATALFIAALAIDGFDSTAFSITFVLGSLFLWLHYSYERKFAQLNSKVNGEEDSYSHLVTLKEGGVAAGIGLLLGLAMTVDYWSSDSGFLFQRSTQNDGEKAIIVFGVLLIIEVIIHFILGKNKKLKKLPTSRKIQRMLSYTVRWPALVGVIFGIFAKERVGTLDQRIWVYLIGAWIVIGSVWAYRTTYRNARKHLKEEAEHFKSEKKKSKKSPSKKKKSSKKKSRK